MAVALRSRDPDPSADQRVILHHVPWWQYEALLAQRADASVPRLTYLEGALEIMSPTFDHEAIEKLLARLVEAWADATGTLLTGVGSWTVRDPAVERGAEPDECYIVGPFSLRGPRPSRPDIAIEVVWTHGGLDKLEVWRKLGVPEVWVWEDGEIAVHVREGEAWVRESRSRLLPGIDLAHVGELLGEESQAVALRKLRERLAAG
jgi:Uma2 family endonuclease